MGTLTTKAQLYKPALGEPGATWQGLVSSNFDKIDAAPGVGHLFPRAQSSPNMTLAVAAGIGYTGTAPIYFLGGNSPTFTAPSTNSRIDLLYMNSSGVLVVLQGAENVSPVPPTYPSSIVPICEVYVRVSSTVINNTDAGGSTAFIMRDVRPTMRAPGGAGGVSGVHKVGSADIVGSVGIGAGSGIDLTQSGQDITVANLGVLGAGMTGGSLFAGNVRFAARDGIGIEQDIAQKIIRFFNTNPPSFPNPMTTPGDIIKGGAAGVAQRLALGSVGQVLTVIPGDVGWAAAPTGKRAASRTVASTSGTATSQAGADYVCNGSTDQVEINQAITDISSTGGEVVVLEGTYILSAAIVLPSNVRLKFVGATLKIQNSLNSSMDVISIGNTVTNVTITGALIDGNKANNSAGTQNGISIGTGCSRITVEHCYIDALRNNGVLVNSSSSPVIHRCHITNCTLEGINLQGAVLAQVSNCLIAANNNGFYLVGAIRCMFTNCTLYSHANRNIFIGSSSVDNTIIGCYIYAAVWEGIYLSSGSRNSILSCQFNQNGVGTNATYAQIEFAAGVTNNVIMGSTFIKGSVGNLPLYGIWIRATATNTVVYPNAFPDGGGTAATINDQGTGSNLGPDITVQRSNTYVIAASDATTQQRNGADYVCDGTADNVEWQAMLDALHTAGGGSVMAVGKTFVFANRVEVGHSVSINGDSVGTVIQWGASVGVDNVGLFQKRSSIGASPLANFTLSNVTLACHATQTNSNLYGLSISGSTNMQLSNVRCVNFKSHGFNLTDAVRAYLVNCAAQTNGGRGYNLTNCDQCVFVGAYAYGNTLQGFYMNLCDNTTHLNSIAQENTTDGISLIACNNTSLIGCAAFMAGQSGTTSGYVVSGGSAVNITGCHSKNNHKGIDISGFSQGLSLSASYLSGNYGIDVTNTTSMRITGCQIIGNANDVIRFNSGVTESIIQGCYIWCGSGDGIRFVSSTDCSIALNNFYNYSTTAIRLSSSSHRATITNNTFRPGAGTGDAIIINASDFCTVSLSQITIGSAYGIHIMNGSDQVRVYQNRVNACETIGIGIDSGCLKPYIYDNNVTACGRNDYSTTGTGIDVGDCDDARISNNIVTDCYGSGITVANADGFVIEDNTVENNHNHGVNMSGCVVGDVANNRVKGNGQRTNVTYDNYIMAACSSIRFRDNITTIGTNSNKPRYGINIASCTDIRLITPDNFLGGGQTADINNGSPSQVRLIGGFLGFVDLYIPPPASAWTWVNQGGATVTDVAGAVVLTVPSDGTTYNWRGLFVTMPAAPFTLEFCLVTDAHHEGASMQNGGVLRNSSSGLLVGGTVLFHNGSYQVEKWNSPTSLNTLALANGFGPYRFHPQTWHKIQDNNTNRIFSTSVDGGRSWRQQFSESRTAFVTPNQIGWWGNTGFTKPMYVTLTSWRTY